MTHRLNDTTTSGKLACARVTAPAPSTETNMSTKRSPLTESPITQVSSEILSFIFIFCLPRYPLQQNQPDISTAPMLLMHVCSLWRTVALTSATLWSHLAVRLRPIVVRPDFRVDGPDDNYWQLESPKIDFLVWWKGNRGAIAPFIRLQLVLPNFNYTADDVQLEADQMTFLWNYLATAQYLDLDPYFWTWKDNFELGPVFPLKPSTLIRVGQKYLKSDCFYQTQSHMVSLSALQHLSIQNDVLPPDFDIPTHWSTLTHISLSKIDIHLDFWSSFIRSFLNLQWASIEIDKLFLDCRYQPIQHTLHHLLVLLLTVEDHEIGEEFDFEGEVFLNPHSLLLGGLHFPAIHTLLLSTLCPYPKDDSDINESSEYESIISDLHNLLDCAPTLNLLSLAAMSLNSIGASLTPQAFARIPTQPIWTHATHLTQLEFHSNELQLHTLPSKIVSSGWLDLKNPGYPIRKIKILAVFESSTSCDKLNSMIHAETHNIDHVASNVVIQISNQSIVSQTMEAWKEWGART